MIELPEAFSIAADLRKTILNKKIIHVGGHFTDHKFTFYMGDPNQYNQLLTNKMVTNIVERYFYVEIQIEDYTLWFRDGANLRYCQNQPLPKKSKLLLVFDDGSYLNMTTSMYAAIGSFKTAAGCDHPYYQTELHTIGPLHPDFTYAHFKNLLNEQTLKLSAKAFLATDQRILGVGNGSVQDILFHARLHPKRKMITVNENELKCLYESLITTLKAMIAAHGRDTEKDIFNRSGGYRTLLSKNTYKSPCPVCHHPLCKEQYLGGSIYYCPHCQK
ncbi:formamidopyrimidine-DNA glycosylase [Beduini massiliensis]|uniref:formamidopyrimidine-DNA glycosylase n=1 Tax=Beduini massiliensis TaxID=1585974 RepID=UPI00059AA426|nr:formamidopyrimidine-DNA glycosylase [Beduini massiliensis]